MPSVSVHVIAYFYQFFLVSLILFRSFNRIFNRLFSDNVRFQIRIRDLSIVHNRHVNYIRSLQRHIALLRDELSLQRGTVASLRDVIDRDNDIINGLRDELSLCVRMYEGDRVLLDQVVGSMNDFGFDLSSIMAGDLSIIYHNRVIGIGQLHNILRFVRESGSLDRLCSINDLGSSSDSDTMSLDEGVNIMDVIRENNRNRFELNSDRGSYYNSDGDSSSVLTDDIDPWE
jgi:hypothetical protein